MSRIILALFALLLLVPPAQAQTAEDLFQQAVRVERLSGNTEAAIKLYEQIVEEHSDNREITAKALMKLGKAYEAMGSEKAQQAYSRLASDFSDFDNLASEARGRIQFLRGLATASPISNGKYMLDIAGRMDGMGSALSPDGTKLVGISNQTGFPAIINVSSGEYRELVSVIENDGWGTYPRMSPGGNLIAFGSWPNDSRNSELKLLNVASGKIEVLLKAYEDIEPLAGFKVWASEFQAHDWTKDGSAVLTFVYVKNDVDQSKWYQALLLVPIDGSEHTVISEGEDMRYYNWTQSCLSSDDKFVFADFDETDDEVENPQIRRISVQDGSREWWRSSTSKSNMLLGCAHDLGKIAYSSSLLGSSYLFYGEENVSGDSINDFQSIPLADGSWGAAGSSDGRVAVFTGGYENNFSLLRLDETSTEVLSVEKKMPHPWNWSTSWTTDGKKFAFSSSGSNGGIGIYHVDSGITENIITSGSPNVLHWTNDEQRLVALWGNNLKGSSRAAILDVQTGNIIHEFDQDVTNEIKGLTNDSDRLIGFNKDSSCFYLFNGADPTSRMPFVCPGLGSLKDMSLVPDPSFEKYRIWAWQDDGTYHIGVVDIDGSNLKYLYEGQWDKERIIAVLWGKKGEIDISFYDPKENNEGISRAIAIDVNTGDQTELFSETIRFTRARRFFRSPDGKRVVLLSSTTKEHSGDLEATIVDFRPMR